MAEWFDWAASFGTDVGVDGLFLDYRTDLMEDPRVGYRRVVDSLVRAPHPADVTTRHLVGRPLSAVLTKPADVEQWLDESTHAWMWGD